MMTKEWLMENALWCPKKVRLMVCTECPYYGSCPWMKEYIDTIVKNRQKESEEKVKNWNFRYIVGQKVIVTKDLGDTFETVTRSKAQVLPSGSPVIWVEGIAGCYLLDRVTAIS